MGGTGGEPADDPSILADDPLWRRVHPTQVILDKNQGVHRPSSSAFDDHPNGTPMSIVLGKDATAKGRSGEAILEKFHGYSLAAITADMTSSIESTSAAGAARRRVIESARQPRQAAEDGQ